MMNWRDFVRNEPAGIKALPSIVSPGGWVCYCRDQKWPQLPLPDFLGIDYPFIQVDNWQICFFPMQKNEMRWLSESLIRWVRQHPECRARILDFMSKLENLSRNPPCP